MTSVCNYLKEICKRNKLQDLSFTGEQFNKHNIDKIINKLPITYSYFTGKEEVNNYILDNITIKVRNPTDKND